MREVCLVAEDAKSRRKSRLFNNLFISLGHRYSEDYQGQIWKYFDELQKIEPQKK